MPQTKAQRSASAKKAAATRQRKKAEQAAGEAKRAAGRTVKEGKAAASAAGKAAKAAGKGAASRASAAGTADTRGSTIRGVESKVCAVGLQPTTKGDRPADARTR